MKGMVIFLLLIAGIALFSFLVISTDYDKPKIEVKNQFEFSTFTSAVCENKEDSIYCKDEVFVNCNGALSKAVDVAECNGIKFEIPKATGLAVFDKEWKDPRNN